LASLHQIIETVNEKLLNTFRLARERPHALDGFQARLAAKVACITFVFGSISIWAEFL
jgi:hypothetical protein